MPTKEEILRNVKFLSEEQYRCLQESEDLLDRILFHKNSNHMKKNLYLTHPSQNNAVTLSFYAKRYCGRWKSYNE